MSNQLDRSVAVGEDSGVSIDTHPAKFRLDLRYEVVAKGLQERDDCVLLCVSQVQVA